MLRIGGSLLFRLPAVVKLWEKLRLLVDGSLVIGFRDSQIDDYLPAANRVCAEAIDHVAMSWSAPKSVRCLQFFQLSSYFSQRMATKASSGWPLWLCFVSEGFCFLAGGSLRNGHLQSQNPREPEFVARVLTLKSDGEIPGGQGNLEMEVQRAHIACPALSYNLSRPKVI